MTAKNRRDAAPAPKPRPARVKTPASADRVPPASGHARWLRHHPGVGMGWLEITPTGGEPATYMVERGDGRYHLYRVNPATKAVVRYTVVVAPSRGRDAEPVLSCDCPDATNRRQHACKHVMALRAVFNKYPL